MKRLFTIANTLRLQLSPSGLIASLIVLTFSPLSAQPDYVFDNPSLESGTDKQVNAVYRFPTVAAGADALVTISAIVNCTIDEMNYSLSGHSEAFQPSLLVDPNSNAYVEFVITFVASGTSIPASQASLYITSIDVDGGAEPCYEYDHYYLPGALVDFDQLGTELSMSQSGGWTYGDNVGGVDYLGIDTVQKSVMFTVVAANTASFTVRMGTDNQSENTLNRLRSLYFKHFQYPNSYLPVDLLTFSATRNHDGIDLEWATATELNADYFTVQRSLDLEDWSEVGQLTASGTTSGRTDYLLTDYQPHEGASYYRLLQTDFDGTTHTIAIAKAEIETAQPIVTVHGNPSQGLPMIQVTTPQDGEVSIQVLSLNGSVVQRLQFSATAQQSIVVALPLNLESGMHVIAWSINDQNGSEKLIVAR